MMNETLYLVTFDGYLDQYGCEIYLGGIFDSEDKAKDYVNKMMSGSNIKITPVIVNHEYPIEKKDAWVRETDVYLGGYVE